MKTCYKTQTMSLAAMAFFCASAPAAVIFNDTFDTGTGAWYRAGIVNTLSNSSGQLAWSGSVGSGGGGSFDAVREVIGRSFTTQTLQIGQSIRLTFDYTQSTASAGNIFRVGFYDVANPIDADGWSTESGELIGTYSGYTGFIRDAGTTNPLRHETGTDTTATNTGLTMAGTDFATLSGNGTSFDILENTQYKVSYELFRDSATTMQGVFKLMSADGSITHQNITGSTTTIYDTFDTVVLRSVNPVLYDNVEVSIIPEPGAALLGCIGLFTLLRRRR